MNSEQRAILSDKTGLAHIFVDLCDETGNTVYSALNEITCEIEGPARLLGMEDSNPSNVEDYKDNKQHAYHGKLLIYLQASGRPGNVRVKLSSPGLEGTAVDFEVK
jgi:beta-galactosidase